MSGKGRGLYFFSLPQSRSLEDYNKYNLITDNMNKNNRCMSKGSCHRYVWKGHCHHREERTFCKFIYKT